MSAQSSSHPEPLEASLNWTAQQRSQIQKYTDLLLKWNRRINLTRITQDLEIKRQHFGEAFFLVNLLPISVRFLLDVGSGAGFPGLAMKIARPDLHVTLLEASSKKCAFLNEVIGILGFQEGAGVVNCRLEEFKSKLEKFDIITMRGVRLTSEMAGRVWDLMRPEGQLLISTSSDQAARIRDLGFSKFQWKEISSCYGNRRIVLTGLKCST